jgi:hypothetical protein
MRRRSGLLAFICVLPLALAACGKGDSRTVENGSQPTPIARTQPAQPLRPSDPPEVTVPEDEETGVESDTEVDSEPKLVRHDGPTLSQLRCGGQVNPPCATTPRPTLSQIRCGGAKPCGSGNTSVGGSVSGGVTGSGGNSNGGVSSATTPGAVGIDDPCFGANDLNPPSCPRFYDRASGASGSWISTRLHVRVFTTAQAVPPGPAA